MRPISAWSRLMSSTVLVAARLGTDDYAKPNYDTAVAYKAHLSRKAQLVRTQDGQQVQSLLSAHLNSSVVILPTAQVTLSTADVGSTEATLTHPTIVAVDRRYDQGGPHHTVLFF